MLTISGAHVVDHLEQFVLHMERSSLVANARVVGPAHLGHAEQLDRALGAGHIGQQVGGDRAQHVLTGQVDVVVGQLDVHLALAVLLMEMRSVVFPSVRHGFWDYSRRWKLNLKAEVA